MRVLMVSKALVTGVYQKKLEELAAFQDIEVLVVVPPSWKESRVGELHLTRQFTEGYTMVAEPMRFNGRHHVHFYPGLAAKVREFRPDVMHIDEEPYNLVTAHATRLARQIGARTLFFTWQNLDRRYPPPFSLFERYAYRHASAALAGNEEAKAVLRRKRFRGPIEVIPQFGVDPDFFKPGGRDDDAPRDFTVGYYGRLVPEKGIDTLIEAIALLETKPRAVIVGSGDSLEELRALALQRGVADTVEFRGPVAADAIPALLAELDVVVVPSRTRANWKEQFGRVIIESMACEVPVIGSDSGEIPNVIGDSGLTFPEGDAHALATQLQSLIDNRNYAKGLGRAGRARVLERYTQRQIASATRDVYHRVMEL